MKNHKFSLSEIESMVPWERDIYVTMLINTLQQEKELIQQKQLQRN